MSSIGGYTSRRYAQMEDLAERADWVARNTPEFDDAIKQYLAALHAAAEMRASEEPQPRLEALPTKYGPRVPRIKRGRGRPKKVRSNRSQAA